MIKECVLETLTVNTNEASSYYHNIFSEFKFHNPFNSLELIKPLEDDENTLVCFVLRKKNVPIIIMPVYVRPIEAEELNDKYYDAISPYGYSGPMYDANIDDDYLRFFWSEVDSWYLQNNVVSEFIRFSLNYNYRCYTGNLDPSLVNVRGRLLPIETLWKNFKQKVRNNVRKAEKSNLRFEIFHGEFGSDIIKNFHDIYIDTMDRNMAANKYYFSLAYFKQLLSNNPLACAIAFVYDKQTPISAELILISEDSIYSFLGGTNSKYFEVRPNDYLKYKVAEWGFNQNKQYYILGGGRENKDGLYSYKKSFFSNDQDAIYYTGRKIVNLDMYKKLTELSLKFKINEFERNIVLNYFPIYRSNKSNA